MRSSFTLRRTILALAVFVGGCGGQVSQTTRVAGNDAAPATTSEGGAPGSNADSSSSSIIGDDSCVALDDCCGEFQGSVAAACVAVVEAGNSQACSNQVDTYRSQGQCE